MIRSDFHVHTTFADGKNTPEEMVLAAISAKMEAIGFSEHAYVPFDPGFCMSPESSVLYRREIARLKDEYAGRIKILCGVEMDYDSVDDPGVYDYVIGSVHYLSAGGNTYSVDLSPQETLRCVNEGFGGDFDSYAEAYFEKLSLIKEKTGAHVIGHFDLITKFAERGVSPDAGSTRYINAWKTAVQRLAGGALLEINTGAVSRGCRTEPYPAEDILREWRRRGGRVLLSGDAHSAEHIAYGFDKAEALAKRCGYTSDGICGSPVSATE